MLLTRAETDGKCCYLDSILNSIFPDIVHIATSLFAIKKYSYAHELACLSGQYSYVFVDSFQIITTGDDLEAVNQEIFNKKFALNY